MAATVQELIKKSISIYFKGISPNFKTKLEMIAFHFGSIESFLKATKDDIDSITLIDGTRPIKLTD
ncbi:MAG: hypothetical protein ACOVQA_03435, partial [Thermoflexibacteraceae bacterium]